MSAEPQQVRVPTPRGERRVGTVLDAIWAPRFNDKDRELLRVAVDGVPIRVRADKAEAP